MNTTVDALMRGGYKIPEGKRKSNIRDIQKGVKYLSKIKSLLGEDNTIYRYMIEGISNGMNTPIDEMLDDHFMNELLVVEILIQNAWNGHYVDLQEAQNLLEYDRCKSILQSKIDEGKPDWFNNSVFDIKKLS